MNNYVNTFVCGVFEGADRRPIDSGEPGPIRGRFDAASDSPETRQIWMAADSYDADAAHSTGVRQRLRTRSRYEQGNNGFMDGMVATHANYVVGRGPRLRLATGNNAFNSMVEARWSDWCAASGFNRKLRTQQRAKTGDGEGIGILKTNLNIRDAVKLDYQLVECDQMTTPFLPTGVPGKIDGLEFDEFGNVVDYQILPCHPGGLVWNPILSPDNYPARFVCHLYDRRRPGQHRGIPALTSTLNLYATGRRYREATVAAAETAADMAAMLEMGSPNDGPDEYRPFTSVPIEKRMIVMTPAGAKLSQMRAEHPPTGYPEFIRTQVGEQGRPISMSYNIAACDNSNSSFSGGKLDHLTYFVQVDVDQADIEEDILEKVFATWFREAVAVYGWNVFREPPPAHSWRWPARPKIDEEKTATARKIALSTGQTHLRRLYEEDGLDFDEEVTVAARDFGVTEDELRRRWFDVIFVDNQKSATGTDGGQGANGTNDNGRGVAAAAKRNGRPAFA
jgi:capsid protein